jgi:hypothetical protein
MATQQTVRTYRGSNGTLTLRCNERFSPPNQSITKSVLLAGSCVVHNATGAYAGLKGSGRLRGTATFITDSQGVLTTIIVQDTLTL